jgi:hypothetical protein
MCPIRICATDRGEESCGYCDDYPCDRLVPHFEHAPQMRDLLDGLRRQYLTAA